MEKEEDLALTDLTPHCNYRPSQEIAEAIAGAQLGWATEKDEDKENNQEPENGDNTGGEGGGGTQGGELEG